MSNFLGSLFKYIRNMGIFIRNKFFISLVKTQNKTFSACLCTKEEKKWKVVKVNHLAIASANLDKSIKLYRDILGMKTRHPIPMAEHGVVTTFVELDNVKLELLIPLGEKSPIQNYLQKNVGGGMHHICLDVDDIESAVEDMKKNNIRTLTEKTKIGAHGKPVIFLHPKDCGGVLIELQQA